MKHTSGRANNYPLYYFVRSITSDGRYLVFHSDRTGWVQLHRLDLSTGEVEQLTEGRTWDSGWAIWCEYHLRGIYNHLSVLDPESAIAYYFDGSYLESVSVRTGVTSRIYDLEDRMPIGQSAVSPNGTYIAVIHADRRSYTASLQERETLQNMGRFDWASDHQAWRNNNPSTISVFNIETGTMFNEIDLDFHVHHVLFINDKTLVVNHVRNGNGMFRVDIDGSGERVLRSENAHGAVCHQVVTAGGIRYEASRAVDGVRRTVMGAYNPATDTFFELPLREPGYVHTGFDPAGDFIFLELDGEEHGIYTATLPVGFDPKAHDSEAGSKAAFMQLELLHGLSPVPAGQRYQAHPFLSPDRNSLFFTEMVDGYSQVCSIDVSNRVGTSAGWLSLSI